MSETFFTADLHFDHPGIIRHCQRPWLRPGDLDGRGQWASEEIKKARTDEMNEGMVASWNGVVSSKDVVYIVGDFAWKNHRRWVNELNGKKVFLIGSHDKMPQDTMELFKPEVQVGHEESVRQAEVLKTMVQFREVHSSLVRQVCGQWMHLFHWPMATWQGKPHGSWAVVGHTHGRYRKAQPGEASGGLILDVGWDVFKRPLSFGELRAEMKVKFDKGATRYETPTEVERE